MKFMLINPLDGHVHISKTHKNQVFKINTKD